MKTYHKTINLALAIAAVALLCLCVLSVVKH